MRMLITSMNVGMETHVQAYRDTPDGLRPAHMEMEQKISLEFVVIPGSPEKEVSEMHDALMLMFQDQHELYIRVSDGILELAKCGQ